MSLLPSGVDCYPFHVLHIGLFTDQLRAGMLLVWWGVEFILPGPCEAVLLTQYYLPLHSSTASQGHQGINQLLQNGRAYFSEGLTFAVSIRSQQVNVHTINS